LVQGGLEIPVEVTIEWQDKRAMSILKRKAEEVSYPLGDSDHYNDESKDILKTILKEDVSSDSEDEVVEL
jgi:hypothetical protein